VCPEARHAVAASVESLHHVQSVFRPGRRLRFFRRAAPGGNRPFVGSEAELVSRRRRGAARPAEPIRVAIMGGGCAGISAAFELTRPEHRGRFAVTVYQQGWRLGGKGASGRGEAGRIGEHGLHVWMGFYENAFRLIRECYAELGKDPETESLGDWREAFSPAPPPRSCGSPGGRRLGGLDRALPAHARPARGSADS